MTAHVLELPPELLDNIFCRLPPRDVASCRLACSAFTKLASPYLITRVVYARRLDTIRHLREVLEHPYFSKQVTELVYDASRYSDVVARDFGEYEHRCFSAHRRFVERNWESRNKKVAAELNELTALSRAPPAGGSYMEGERDVEEILCAEDDHYSELFVESLWRGCYKGFDDYLHRVRADAELTAIDLLPYIFSKATRLNSIVFTDYRGTALPDDSYNGLCRRLFGNTLEPVSLSDPDWGSWA